MGKKKATAKVTKPTCDHEAREVSKGDNGATFWACPCGEKQWVSGPQTEGKLLELFGAQRLNVEGRQDKGRTVTTTVIDDPIVMIPRAVGEKIKAIAQHSSESNEHPTPPEIVEAARRVMGGVIHLDPATSIEFNKQVRALNIHTESSDGLMWDWNDNVFLNPPGGVVRMGKTPYSSAAIWWAKLVKEWQAARTVQAVFVGFTLEILRLSQVGQKVPVQCFHRCYPRERLRFGGKDQPTHANVIAYLPPVPERVKPQDYWTPDPYWIDTFSAFELEFKDIGFCEPGWFKPRA